MVAVAGKTVRKMGMIVGQIDGTLAHVAYCNIVVVAPSANQNSCLKQGRFPSFDLLRNCIYPEARGTMKGFGEWEPGNDLLVDRIRSSNSWSRKR